MKKALLSLIVIAAIGGSIYAYYRFRDTAPKFTVTTAQVSRGDVVESVGATGTLQAVTTVQVGTQVSGTIESLYADFNSLVKKGQVLARLDPSLFQTQIEQARANLIRAQADLARLNVALDDAKVKLNRARELSQRQLIPKTDLETAEVNVRSAEAQIQSSQAQVTQARASLNQNEVNIAHTVIEAPIDGMVISRNVDVGQTVAASMQAPTLFVLAADLTKMQVVANLDESDVGRIRPGQGVTFRVDAYPTDTFNGLVSQVRLQPTVQQNVVTYATVIDVPNQQLKLKPGMTANVNIEIAKAANVLRIPNAALRFRPTTEMYTALGLTPPDPAAGRGRGGPALPGADGPSTSAPAPAAPSTQRQVPAAPAAAAPAAAAPAASPAAPATQSAEARSRRSGNGAPANGAAAANGDEGGGRRGGGGAAARMQNMSPEEREAFIARMRARGFDPTAAGGAGAATASGSAPARGRGAPPPATAAAERSGGATTIDALFGPLPRTESTGRVFLHTSTELQPVRVRLGISDGQNTELIEGDLQPGTELVTNITIGGGTRPAATSTFPGLGQPQRGGFPGGGGQGGNRGGGNTGARR